MKTMKTPFFRYAPVKMMNLEKANREAALLFCRKTKNTWVFRKGLGLYVCNSQTAHYLGGLWVSSWPAVRGFECVQC